MLDNTVMLHHSHVYVNRKTYAFFCLKIAKFNSTIHLYSGILFCTSGV